MPQILTVSNSFTNFIRLYQTSTDTQLTQNFGYQYGFVYPNYKNFLEITSAKLKVYYKVSSNPAVGLTGGEFVKWLQNIQFQFNTLNGVTQKNWYLDDADISSLFQKNIGFGPGTIDPTESGLLELELKNQKLRENGGTAELVDATDALQGDGYVYIGVYPSSFSDATAQVTDFGIILMVQLLVTGSVAS